MRRLRKLVLIFLLVTIIFVWAGGLNFSAISTSIGNGWRSLSQMLFSKVSLTLVVPELPTNLEDARYFSHHWKGDLGYFVLLSKELTSLVGPDVHAQAYKELHKAQRVRVLFEQGDNVLGDSAREGWVFVADETGHTHLGWVLAEHLVLSQDFTRVKRFPALDFKYDKGEFSAHISVDETGRFVSNWSAEGGGLALKGEDKGHLYENDDIIWARKHKQDAMFDFFILNDVQIIEHEYRFQKWKIEVTQKEKNNG